VSPDKLSVNPSGRANDTETASLPATAERLERIVV